MNAQQQAISVLELNRRLSAAVAAAPGLQNVWVVAETSDLRMSGGHCYMELVEKSADGGTAARIRANVWANVWSRLSAQFLSVTGVRLASGMKIMACVTANYHPAYGMSVNISAIDPSYTMGEAVRRRNEIIARLQAEGSIGLNRQLRWAAPALRIAVISAQGAAGYGDFINQLYTNELRLAFTTQLFPALMQGDRAVASVLEALRQIGEQADDFDGVVIIRGGGATTELAAFDNYELANTIAHFPLPVIVGIGHERDITVLDYVANMRVKTPTAAAEWLIARGKAVLEALARAGNLIYQSVSQRLAGNREQLGRIEAALPGIVDARMLTARSVLQRHAMVLAQAVPRIVAPQRERLQALRQALALAPKVALAGAVQHLDARQALLKALSPEATLLRGFTITRGPDGHAVRPDNLPTAGQQITTVMAGGITLASTVK